MASVGRWFRIAVQAGVAGLALITIAAGALHNLDNLGWIAADAPAAAPFAFWIGRLGALMLEHWFAFVMLTLVWASIAGRVGVGLGIDNFFREDEDLGERATGGRPLPPGDPRRILARIAASPALFSGLGATYMGGVIWMSVLPDYDAAQGVEPFLERIEPAFWTDWFAATLVAALITCAAAQFEYVSEATREASRGERVRGALGVLLGLAAVTLVHLWIVWAADWGPRAAAAAASGGRPYLTSFAWICVGAVGVASYFSIRDRRRAALRALLTALAAMAFLTLIGGGPREVASTAVTLIVAIAVVGYPKLLPALSYIGLALIFALVGIVLGELSGGAVMAILIAVALWITAANNNRFKYRIPGLGGIGGPDPYENTRLLTPNETRLEPSPDALDPREALIAWRRDLAAETDGASMRGLAEAPGRPPVPEGADYDAPEADLPQRRTKPKLVVLAVSGGAFRATFWTATMLDAFACEASGDSPRLPGFTRSIRVLTGASGGTVASAYFAAMFSETGEPPAGGVADFIRDDGLTAPTGPARSKAEALRCRRRFPIPRDALTAVAAYLIRDLTRLFWPGPTEYDRGRALEDQWPLLASTTFGQMREREAAGRAPSLIVTPTLVETGAPLFISNLSLDEARDKGLAPGVAVEPAAAQRPAKPGPEQARRRADRRNRESVELFDLLPRARSSLTLATAIRLNCTFPYVSPAVSLPTIPKRRVIDAGYYDNFGVDVATKYLGAPDISDWIARHTSGVAVIQLRASPLRHRDRPFGPIARAFHWLTSPIEGVAAARGAAMIFRNNHQLRDVLALLESKAAAFQPGVTFPEGFARSFVFENHDPEPSLNWYLPKHELESMEAQVDKIHNGRIWAKLFRFWNAG